MTKNKNKTTKKGGSRFLATAARNAVGALYRSNRNMGLITRPFIGTAINPGTGKKSGLSLEEFRQPKQPVIDLGVRTIPSTGSIIYDKDQYKYTGKIIPNLDSIRSKVDIGSTMMRTSVMAKFAIGTLIAAFLSVLIKKSKLGEDAINELKNDANDLVNKTAEAVYKYMITTASERIQEGDTAIIASLYGTIGQYISSDARKNILENIVIDGVSYGWLAEYDAVIDAWLKKIIEIKGGELPSDKYIINIVNIIQNKVIPVTSKIWYYKRAIKIATGLGITEADTASDDYWYTSEGLHSTASGVRQMVAEDAYLSKIVIGILSASEMYNRGLIETIFGGIRPMIRQLINKMKDGIANPNDSDNLKLLRKSEVISSLKPIRDDDDHHDDTNNIVSQINELKELDRYWEKSKKNIYAKWEQNKRYMKTTKHPTAHDSILQDAFTPFSGGVRKRHLRRTRRPCISRRQTMRKLN